MVNIKLDFATGAVLCGASSIHFDPVQYVSNSGIYCYSIGVTGCVHETCHTNQCAPAKLRQLTMIIYGYKNFKPVILNYG